MQRISLANSMPSFLLATCLVSTFVAAACYVCGEVRCEYETGGPCGHPSTVKICETAPRDANPGEQGFVSLQGTARLADCWTVTSTSAGDWYQGPCSAGPPALGRWFHVGSCGLANGQCCWTKVNYSSSGVYSNAGFMMSDCDEQYACIAPLPPPQ